MTFATRETWRLYIFPRTGNSNIHTHILFLHLRGWLGATLSVPHQPNSTGSSTCHGSPESMHRPNLPKIVLTDTKLFATNGMTADFDNMINKCTEVYGRIATPTNWKENDAIMSFAKQHNAYVYLGIIEGHVPGEFHFINGTTLNYTNWYVNEPSGKGTEKCVEMYTDGTWNDKACNHYRLTVCEF
uniref:C-type lectin domain-containing protein n=1 Tax=Salvator merianae TaxID=96440 RepID=A0A8D0BHC4_SALMN